MSKICKKCFYEVTDESTVFCPACGSILDGQDHAASKEANDRRYAQPVNAGAGRHYAQPNQMKPQPVKAEQPKPAKTKKRLPYILIGFFAAAAIFTVLLIVVLGSGNQLVGNYTWTNGEDGATGSLSITESDGKISGLFIYDGKGTVNLTFNPKQESVFFYNTDSTLSTGTYKLDGDDLSITVNNYTDTFKRK